MPLVEAVTIELGAAIAKSILKLWVKDSTLGEEISSSLITILKSRTSDVLAQRRGERQFEIIGEKVAENLLPLFEAEGARLDEGSCTAIAIAAAEAFNKAKISSTLLAERNLEPTQLAKYVLTVHPTAIKLFSTDEIAFYQRIIEESCSYIIGIASQLPEFKERTFAEVLKREDQIIASFSSMMRELSQIRKQLDPMAQAGRFEISYREAVARNLDVLRLIGADLSLTNRLYRLSLAYIPLYVEQKLSHVGESSRGEQSGINKDYGSINNALASSRRLLVRGHAGSGKTTLLQWIAVRAATRSFEGILSDWNDYLPFYIRLRQCVQSGLPEPVSFPGFVAPAIAGTIPQEWIYTILRSGRAIILIDGVDEISTLQRDDVYMWLKDLVETYKKARFIVTSRPHAIEEGWMDDEGFVDAQLQPMSLSHINSLIDHWHQAVQEELHFNEEKDELKPLADHLKVEVKRNRSIRHLATNPLLCAMLCALNRERRRQLPVNRIELYRACCSLLLERRDKESHVDLSDYPVLNYSQKSRLLEDLAYWMIKEELSEAPVSFVDEHFAHKLVNMPSILPDISSAAVRQLFVERTGLIREPVEGQVDFTHRTFQEFFAAQAVLDTGDVELLVENAHNDQWREVIILAAGLASKKQAELLINGLIIRGDQEKDKQYQLHPLAVACLETAIELGPEVRAKVEDRLRQLVPPQSWEDAEAVAAAGDLAVKYLVRSECTDPCICIRSLSLIGSEAALKTLEEYAALEGYDAETCENVIHALISAWDAFDGEIYGKRVLSRTAPNILTLSIEALPSSLEGIEYLARLAKLEMNSYHISDLSPLIGSQQLTDLTLSYFSELTDLTPVAKLAQLTSLHLYSCSQVSDLTPLAGLTQLTLLDMSYCSQVSDLTPLAGLTQLTSLDLSGCSQVSDLNFLVGLKQLKKLQLYGCTQIRNLKSLAELDGLEKLTLSPHLRPTMPLSIEGKVDIIYSRYI